MSTPLLTNVRVYYNPLAPQPVEWQREVCEEVVARLGLPHVTYSEDAPGRDRREAWATALLADEIAVVATLEVLARTPTGKARKTADWVAAVGVACQNAHHMVEASTGITSLEKRRWAARINVVANKIANGRVLTRKRARRMAKISVERRPQGTVATWLDESYRARREAAKKRWHGARSRREAWEALTEKDRRDLGSISTARRALEDDNRPWVTVDARKPKRR